MPLSRRVNTISNPGAHLDCRFPLDPDAGSAPVWFETSVALQIARGEPALLERVEP